MNATWSNRSDAQSNSGFEIVMVAVGTKWRRSNRGMVCNGGTLLGQDLQSWRSVAFFVKSWTFAGNTWLFR